jgi:hypothetical protein
VRNISELCRQVVTGGSFDISYVADLYYDDRRLFAGLPITDPSFSWDSSGAIEASGSVTVVWTDEQGTSLSPTEPQDWLAPFGSRLIVYAVVSAGNAFTERVQVGDFTITSVPSADDSVFIFGETRIVVGSKVKLELKDRMVEVQRDRFTRLSSPTNMTSVWAEAAALTGFQLTRSLPDAPIRRSVVYEDDRVASLVDLMTIIGGVPHMASDGTLTARPTTPGDPVAALTVGPRGTITQVGASLNSEAVYNGIIIRTEDDDQQQVLAELWIQSGPLRATPPGGARTPYHRVPRFYSSPQIKTPDQAAAVAPQLLAMYSQPRASSLEIQCITDVSVELGDVRTVDDGFATWTVRIAKCMLGASGTMTITGDVLNRVVNS